MSADPIRVVTLADDAYAMPLAVLVRSLLEHHQPGRPLHITILDGGITSANRGRLETSWTSGLSLNGVTWDFVAPRFRNAKDLPAWGRMPPLTYARLALPDYFADDGRVILLDSDMLVLTGLAQLHDLDLAGAVIAAPRDPFIGVVSATDGLATWRDAQLAPDTPYFNAGVMAIDLGRWRREEITRQALKYLESERHRLRQYDQDCLNAVLVNRWLELDERWQAQPRTLWSIGRRPPAEPCVVHYSGRLKPWLYRDRDGADQLFYNYLDRTAWRGFRVPSNFGSRMLRLYDSPVRRLAYPFETRLLAWKRRLDQRRGLKGVIASST